MKIIDTNIVEEQGSRNEQEQIALSRHSEVLGEGAQERLSQLTIGVVGAGGIGSELIEKLMRLAPKRLIVIDDDIIEYTNLNRVVGSTYQDAAESASKVELVSRLISSFNPAQDFTAIKGDFLVSEHQEEFKACDVIFSATDNVVCRFATCALGLANGSAVIDVATGVVMDDQTIKAIGGQVYYITPASGWCPLCAGLYNQSEVSAGLLNPEELERQRAQGYVRGENIAAPQVGALNSILAGYAAWLFMRMVSGEELEFDGIAVDALTFSAHTWRENRETPNQCHYCSDDGNLMKGDSAEMVLRTDSNIDSDSILANVEEEPVEGDVHEESEEIDSDESKALNLDNNNPLHTSPVG